MQIFKGVTSGGCAQGQYSIASGLGIIKGVNVLDQREGENNEFCVDAFYIRTAGQVPDHRCAVISDLPAPS